MITDQLHAHLKQDSSPLIVAVSGGMDSVVLLHLLVQARADDRLSIHVATFDHGIRPEAGEDVDFVKSLCARWDVPCTAGKVDAPLSGNLEASARQARYQFLARVAHEVGAGWVVTAHHADDQAETILLHILRGSGLRGLGGMQVVAPLPDDERLQIFRPMLHLSRQQIEAYCQRHQLSYRHDRTNDDVRYRRNYIRHALLPMLATINPDAVGALNRLGEIASQDYDFLLDVTQSAYQEALLASDQRFIALDRAGFDRLHRAIQHQLLLKMAWDLYQLSPTHERMNQAHDLIHSSAVGMFIEFVGAHRLYLDYHAVIIGDYRAYFRQTLPYIRLEQEQVIDIDLSSPEAIYHGAGWRLQFSHQPPVAYQARLNVKGVKRGVLRTRREGDRFAPMGMGGRGKKLKAWMIDRKIPQAIRDEIGLIELDGVIVAVLYGTEWALGHQPATDDAGELIYIKLL